MPLSPDKALPLLGATESRVPVWPERALRLSATQLEMYEDCPLRYAYRYAAGARREAGIHADLGSLVHEVLERFLDPADPGVLCCRIPADIVALRAADPTLALAWRHALRDTLGAALTGGRRVGGVTREGCYVLVRDAGR